MKARSRAVLAPAALAFLMWAAEARRADWDSAPVSGLPRALIAAPQWAMAQPGSALAAARKSSTAGSKECSLATPVSNVLCA